MQALVCTVPVKLFFDACLPDLARMPDDTWVRFDDSKVEEAQPHLFNFFCLRLGNHV